MAVSAVAGGVGAIVYGSIPKFNSWESWNKRLTETGPIIDCADRYDEYKVFLELSKDGQNDLGHGITFRIEGGNDLKQKGTIPWGAKAKKDDDWKSWKILFQAGKEEIDSLWFKEITDSSYQSNSEIEVCQKGNHKIINPAKNIGENGIEVTSISFVIDKEKCEKKDNSVTCDIQFDPSTNLKWKDGFSPKIIYTL